MMGRTTRICVDFYGIDKQRILRDEYAHVDTCDVWDIDNNYHHYVFSITLQF